MNYFFIVKEIDLSFKQNLCKEFLLYQDNMINLLIILTKQRDFTIN